MKKLTLKRLKAFTLVELIIVITILAILATIAFVSFQNYTKDARDSSRVTTFSNLNNGFEIFFTKVGNYPQPDSPVSYTGGNTTIQMWIVWDNVSKLIGVNTTPKDPLTKQNYIYSLGGNGYYYQIAGEKENTLSSIFTSVYAAWETKLPIVKGNYKMDPSLPSLIPVKTSVTGSWLFDSNVCFIVDGGSNNFSSTSANCIKKKDMNFKTLDSSLVGYWDMETTFNSWGRIRLQDLSWNSYNLFWSWMTQRFQTWWLLSNWIEFNGLGLSSTGYYESEKIMWNIFDKSVSMSVVFKKGMPFEDLYQKILLIWSGTNSATHILFWISQGTYTSTKIYWFAKPESYNWSMSIAVGTYEYPKIDTWNFAYLTYNEGELKFFLNWKYLWNKQYVHSWTYLEKKDYPLRLWWGYKQEYFKWIIDDVKIYNRALSDQEIAQQAKIAGF